MTSTEQTPSKPRARRVTWSGYVGWRPTTALAHGPREARDLAHGFDLPTSYRSGELYRCDGPAQLSVPAGAQLYVALCTTVSGSRVALGPFTSPDPTLPDYVRARAVVALVST